MRGLLLLTIFALSACTTMATLERGAVPTALSRLDAGDAIAVRIGGSWQQFTVVGVNAATLDLETAGGESIVLERANIAEIRVSRRAPGKTAALAAAIYFGALALFCGDSSAGC